MLLIVDLVPFHLFLLDPLWAVSARLSSVQNALRLNADGLRHS